MRRRPAEFFLRDDFVGYGLHDFGAGDEHVARVLHHEDEVGHGGAVNRAPCARAHDEAELRHDARGEDVALKYFGISAKRRDAFLNARAAAVVEADNRRTDFHGAVHDLADFLCVCFGQ